MRVPSNQALAGGMATAVQAAAPVTMVTTAKAFPAWCAMGASWLGKQVAAFPGVGDGGGRSGRLSSQTPPAVKGSGQNISERGPRESWGTVERSRQQKGNSACEIFGQLWAGILKGHCHSHLVRSSGEALGGESEAGDTQDQQSGYVSSG